MHKSSRLNKVCREKTLASGMRGRIAGMGGVVDASWRLHTRAERTCAMHRESRAARSFSEKAEELCAQGRIAEMHKFTQHGSVSTHAHVLRVARTAWGWAHALRLPISDDELLRGAVLHDYYLYDWHDPVNKGHATQHPLRALRNAEADFELTDKERNIISAHMWPLPPSRIPKTREAWLVCFADKWCSLVETFCMRG